MELMLLFLGLYQTIRFMVARGSPDAVLFNYGYDKDQSKVLYSQYRRRIPNSFSRTILSLHRAMIETGEIHSEFSNINFFLPSITDRIEDVNQCFKNVSISPLTLLKSSLMILPVVNLTMQSLIWLVLIMSGADVSGTSKIF